MTCRYERGAALVARRTRDLEPVCHAPREGDPLPGKGVIAILEDRHLERRRALRFQCFDEGQVVYRGRRHDVPPPGDQQQTLPCKRARLRDRVETICVLDDLLDQFLSTRALDRARPAVEGSRKCSRLFRLVLHLTRHRTQICARHRYDTVDRGELGARDQSCEPAHAVADERDAIGIDAMLRGEGWLANRFHDGPHAPR